MTDGKPDGETNIALPESVRNGHNILQSCVDKDSTTANFISEDKYQYRNYSGIRTTNVRNVAYQ